MRSFGFGIGNTVKARRPLIGGPAPAPTPTYYLQGSVATVEGNSGSTAFTFTVARSIAANAGSVQWTVTSTGTDPATAADFVGNAFPSGTVSFQAGEFSKTFSVNVAGDTTIEPDESFTVTLTNVVGGGTIGTATATGNVLNDDSLPLVIFDTDAAGDIDDMTALTAAIDYHLRGEITLWGVLGDSPFNSVAPALRGYLNAYGLQSIPVGTLKSSLVSPSVNQTNLFMPTVRDRFGVAGEIDTVLENGQPKYDDAVTFYRKRLAAATQPVTIVVVGAGSALGRLLDSPGDAIDSRNGVDLMAAKVRAVHYQGGNTDHGFPNPSASDYNSDIEPSATINWIAKQPASVPLIADGGYGEQTQGRTGGVYTGPFFGADGTLDPLKYTFEACDALGTGDLVFASLGYRRSSWDGIVTENAIRTLLGRGLLPATKVGGANGTITTFTTNTPSTIRWDQTPAEAGGFNSIDLTYGSNFTTSAGAAAPYSHTNIEHFIARTLDMRLRDTELGINQAAKGFLFDFTNTTAANAFYSTGNNNARIALGLPREDTNAASRPAWMAFGGKQVLDFDGTDDMAAIGMNTAKSSSKLCFSTLVKFDTFNVAFINFVSRMASHDPRSQRWTLFLERAGSSTTNPGRFGVNYFNYQQPQEGFSQRRTNAATVSINTWYLVQVVFDETGASIWVNGVKADTTQAGTASMLLDNTPSPSEIVLGAERGGINSWFNRLNGQMAAFAYMADHGTGERAAQEAQLRTIAAGVGVTIP